jgi:hypothetical protein
MDNLKPSNSGNKKAPAAKKAGPVKLPSKPISFSNHPAAKSGKLGKTSVGASSAKKGGVNLMKKLSGM